jgi:hypothetical protein
MLVISKTLVFILSLAVSVAAPALADETPSALIQQSREAAKQLQQSLGKALQDAMQKGGAEGAMETCNLKALPITQALSDQLGAEIGRTPLKTRNPKNNPDTWEKKQLEDFLVRLEKGEPIATMESTTTDGNMLRYMRAIPMQAQCAACHGGQVNPKLYQKIQALYPQDQAAGFNVGDLRGAFTITLPIKKEK